MAAWREGARRSYVLESIGFGSTNEGRSVLGVDDEVCAARPGADSPCTTIDPALRCSMLTGECLF